MTRPTDDVLLAFLEGHLGPEERAALLDHLDADPELARELRHVAAGLDAARGLADPEPSVLPALPAPHPAAPPPSGVSPWWLAVAVAATVLIAVPVTRWYSEPASGMTGGRPDAPSPSFVVALHALWPDAAAIEPEERRRRAAEYWAWTTSLADEGVLVAAGDLRWEPGERLAPGGSPIPVAASVVDEPDFMVGMFALRVDSYEAALAIARQCPHLRYGGSVSVRQVASGFVTVPGMSDWSN